MQRSTGRLPRLEDSPDGKSLADAMGTIAPTELTALREQLDASRREMRAKWERERSIPPDERVWEPQLAQQIGGIDQQRWGFVRLELDADRAFLSHLPADPLSTRSILSAEHHADLKFIVPNEKDLVRDGVTILGRGEPGLSLNGQFLKGVLIHRAPYLRQRGEENAARPSDDPSAIRPPMSRKVGRPKAHVVSRQIFEERRNAEVPIAPGPGPLAEAREILRQWPEAGPKKPTEKTVSGHISALWKQAGKAPIKPSHKL